MSVGVAVGVALGDGVNVSVVVGVIVGGGVDVRVGVKVELGTAVPVLNATFGTPGAVGGFAPNKSPKSEASNGNASRSRMTSAVTAMRLRRRVVTSR